MSSQPDQPLVTSGLQHQPLRVAVSILLLLVLVLILVVLDWWIFRDPGLTLLAEGGSLEADRVRTARLYEAYQQWVYLETQRSFSWQARSTKIIFWVSMLVALSGVGLSFWQFVTATKEAERALDEHQVEIKTDLVSLAFRTRSIAVLVLFMSIAYLLIYALLIYPIKGTVSASGGNRVPVVEPEELSPSGSTAGSVLPDEIIEAAENEPLRE